MKSDKQWQWILGAVVGVLAIITIAFYTLNSPDSGTATPPQPVPQTGTVEQPVTEVPQTEVVQPPVDQLPANSIVKDGGFNQSEANNWINFKLKVQQEKSGNFYASNRFNWSFYQEIKVDSGAWYALSASLRKGMSQSTPRICIRFKDSQGAAISDPFDYYHTFVGSDWEKVESVNFRAPDGSAAATLFLMSGDGATHDFDDIVIVPTSAPLVSDSPGSALPETVAPSQQESAKTAPTEAYYTVAAGDTLSKIAAQFNTSAQAISNANGITDASKIFPGQKLIIPSGTN